MSLDSSHIPVTSQSQMTFRYRLLDLRYRLKGVLAFLRNQFPGSSI